MADAKFRPLVIPPEMLPELVIRMASATTVEPVAEVSALSSNKRAATALSIVLAVVWFCMRVAYSVFPATLGLLVKLMPSPVKPAELATEAWA